MDLSEKIYKFGLGLLKYIILYTLMYQLYIYFDGNMYKIIGVYVPSLALFLFFISKDFLKSHNDFKDNKILFYFILLITTHIISLIFSLSLLFFVGTFENKWLGLFLGYVFYRFLGKINLKGE